MECDINNGWCVKDIHDKIRTILNNRVDKLLRKMETWPNIQRQTLKRRRGRGTNYVRYMRSDRITLNAPVKRRSAKVSAIDV